jgi:hypothetical protein
VIFGWVGAGFFHARNIKEMKFNASNCLKGEDIA